MNRHVFLIFVLAVAAGASAAAVEDAHAARIAEILAANPRFDNLGTVEGKTFFSDHTSTYTWDGSFQYCLSSGMEMALVSTPAQIAHLGSKFSIIGPTYYWTADFDLALRRALAFHCTSETNCDLISTDISYNYWTMCELRAK